MLPVVFLLPLILFPLVDQTLTAIPTLWLLALGLVIFPWLIAHFRYNPPGPNRTINGLWLMFLAIAGVTTIISVSPADSVIGLAGLLAAWGYFLIGSSLPWKDWRPLLSKILVGAAGLMSLTSLVILLTGWEYPGNQLNLLTHTYGHNRLTGYLVLSLPLVLVKMAAAAGKKEKIGWRAGGLAMSAAFLLSASRGAWLGILAGLIYLSRTEVFGVWAKKGVRLAVIALIGLLLLPVFIKAYPQAGPLRYIRDHQLLARLLYKPLDQDGRWDYWRQAVRAVAARPWGWGPETGGLYLPKFRRFGEDVSLFVHNQYLEVTGETGIGGGIVFLMLTAAGIWLVHRRNQESNDPEALGLTAGLVAAATMAVIDFDWQFMSIFWLFWLLAGSLTAAEGNRGWSWPTAAVQITVGCYALVALSGMWLVKQFDANWFAGGDRGWAALEPALARLHPVTAAGAVDTGLKRLPPDEVLSYINRRRRLFGDDNRQLDKFLGWLSITPFTGETIAIAKMAVTNDPLSISNRTILAKAFSAAGDEAGSLKTGAELFSLVEGKPIWDFGDQTAGARQFLLEYAKQLNRLGRAEEARKIYDYLFVFEGNFELASFETGLKDVMAASDELFGQAEYDDSGDALLGFEWLIEASRYRQRSGWPRDLLARYYLKRADRYWYWKDSAGEIRELDKALNENPRKGEYYYRLIQALDRYDPGGARGAAVWRCRHEAKDQPWLCQTAENLPVATESGNVVK